MHPLSRGSRRRRAAEGQGKGAKSRRAQGAPSGHGQGKDNTNPSSPCSYLLAFPGGAIPISQEKVLCDRQADDTEAPMVCSVKASGGLFEEQGAGVGGVGCVRLGTSRFFCSLHRKDGFSRVTALGLQVQDRLGGQALLWWDQAGCAPWGLRGKADRHRVISTCARPGIVAELEVQ